MHRRRSQNSSSFPRIAGVQWSSTVESTLWGMAPGVAVVLGIVLGLAEIAPASWQLERVVWRSLWRVPSLAFDVAALRGSCRRGSYPGQGRGRFRVPCPCRSRVPRRGKYKGSMGIWQHSCWSSAEHVSHSITGSHSVTTAPGMA
jgi:hypothetical protein